MHGRQHQVILILVGRPGQIAGGVRRIEREFGEKRSRDGNCPRAARADPDRRCACAPARRCAPGAAGTSRAPGAPARATAAAGRSAHSSVWRAAACRAGRHRRRRRFRPAPRAPCVALCSMVSMHLRALTGPMPGSSCSARNAASVLRGLSAQRSTASMSLMCAASRNFRPPYFTNGILRASSTSSTSLALALRNSTAWRLSATPVSRRLRIWPHTYSAWVARSSSVTYSGLAPWRRASDSRCLRCWRGASPSARWRHPAVGWVER
jgi:hypothetical protein